MTESFSATHRKQIRVQGDDGKTSVMDTREQGSANILKRH